MKKTLILGLGNVLMSDEGIGVEVVNRIDKEKLPESVDVLDGGTGGFHLLHLFDEYDRFIIIDAAITTGEAGKISVIQPKFSKDFPKTLTSHDIGLRDLMQTAELLHDLPEIQLIIITIHDFRNVKMELTPEIEACIPKVHEKIYELAKKA
jgi:hydrogenase maturation protease